MSSSVKKMLVLVLAAAGVFTVFFILAPNLDSTEAVEKKAKGDYERIVVLAPSSVELIYELGLGEKVVGVSSYTKYPAAAVSKPKIGGYTDLDMEALLKLKPDCVVLLKEQGKLKQRLNRMGIATVILSHDSIKGVLDSYRTVGKQFHIEEVSNAKLAILQRQLNQFKQRASELNKPKVLMVIYREQGGSSKMTIAGKQGFHREMIDLTGAVNAYTGDINFPQIGEEELIQMQPDYIIELLSDESADAQKARLYWRSMKHLNAVKAGHVYVFQGSGHMIPGPRMVETMEQLSDILYLNK